MVVSWRFRSELNGEFVIVKAAQGLCLTMNYLNKILFA